jgi:hypothetical protein
MQNLTTANAVLKEIYVPTVREQMQKSSVLLGHVERSSENIDGTGKYATVALMTGYSTGIGARADAQPLPDADYAKFTNIQIPIRTNYGRISVSGKAIRQMKTDKGAFVRAVDSEIKNMVTGFKRDINRQLFGDGMARLATITTGVGFGSTTVTCDTTQYLHEGMSIQIRRSDTGVPVTNGGVDGTSGVTILTIPSSTTFTVAAAPADPGVNAYVVRTDNARTAQWSGGVQVSSNEMYGLQNIVNTTNWLVDPANYRVWQSTIIPLPAQPTNQDILDAMQSAFTACEKNEEQPNLVITTFEARDMYARALTTFRQIVNTIDLKYGFKGLDFNGIGVVADNMAPAGQMFFLNTDHLLLNTASDFEWADEDGNVLKNIAGYDAYEAFMYYDANFSTDRRNVHARITGF